jgi:predicted ATPase
MQATNNVVDMMRESMTTLPDDVSQILQIAACLGSSFDERTLSIVWHEYQSDEDNDLEEQISLEDRLIVAIDKGFLGRKQDEDSKLVWVHDKILEATFSRMPQETVSSVQSRVGKILVSKLGDAELDVAIFVAVNLWNEGCIMKESFDQIRLAELNLRAVKKAIKLAAFESAAKYAAKGVQCLPQDRWTKHYSLTLDLYSTAAEVECVTAQFATAELHCKEVIAQRDHPVEDKIRAYKVLIQRLYVNGKVLEAMELCLDVLKQLGCTFPKTKFAKSMASLAGLARIKLTVKSRTSEEIASMPFMHDLVRIEAMRMMQELTTFCYWTKDPLLLPVVLRSYRWTLKYGLCEMAPATFGTLGVLMGGILFDFEAAKRYGEYALQLMEKLKDKSIQARVHMVVYAGASTKSLRS